MPCRSDYMDPTQYEMDHSNVKYLLEELETGKLPEGYGKGFHPEVYNNYSTGKPQLDEDVEMLCSKLQKVNITKYSLEMQVWWRDHQRADKARLKEELAAAKSKKLRLRAIAKLTPYEQKLLGIIKE